MTLIDASAFIEFLNRTGSRADRAVEQCIRNDEEVALPDIALTEILQGIRDDDEYEAVKKILLTFTILSLRGPDSCLAAADLYRKCRRKGLTIRSTVDLLIAQIALDHKTPLLHNDKDFLSIAAVCELKLYKK